MHKYIPMSHSHCPRHHSRAVPFMPLLWASLYSNIVLPSACQRLSAACMGLSTLVCLLCSAAVMCHSSTNDVFFLRSSQQRMSSVQVSAWFGCSIVDVQIACQCLCCLVVRLRVFRAGRVVGKGWAHVRPAGHHWMLGVERSVFGCPLVGAECIFCTMNGRCGKASLSDTTEHMPKTRVQFCGKEAPAGSSQPIFRLGRVKAGVARSAQLMPRWVKMGNLLRRFPCLFRLVSPPLFISVTLFSSSLLVGLPFSFFGPPV